jgi:hypothetical protein
MHNRPLVVQHSACGPQVWGAAVLSLQACILAVAHAAAGQLSKLGPDTRRQLQP